MIKRLKMHTAADAAVNLESHFAAQSVEREKRYI